MLTLYYGPGACSMASHIVLEESGETYEPRKVDLAGGEQRTRRISEDQSARPRAGAASSTTATCITENTAILPYLGKRFKLWPTDPKGEVRALSLIGWFASSVHAAHAHVGRPERYSADASAYAGDQGGGAQDLPLPVSRRSTGPSPAGNGSATSYSVLDPYGFVFYTWGVRRELPMAALKNYTAFKDRMLARPAVQRVVADEKVKL